jgi:hypothetical protein
MKPSKMPGNSRGRLSLNLTTGPKGSPRLEKKETTHIHLHRASATPRHHLIAKTTSPLSQQEIGIPIQSQETKLAKQKQKK